MELNCIKFNTTTFDGGGWKFSYSLSLHRPVFKLSLDLHFNLPIVIIYRAPPVPKCSVNKQRRRPAESEKSLAHKRKPHGIMLIPGPRGFIRRVDAGPGGAAGSLFVSAPFHQLAGQERQTEESNSIPVRVPTAPPSAQRSWTDQPQCGE